MTHRDRLRGTVSDIEDRDRLRGLNRSQAFHQGMPILKVKGGHRLVAEKQFRARGEGTGEPHALPLATGKGRGRTCQKRTDATKRADLVETRLGLVEFPSVQAIHDIGGDIKMRKKPVILEYHADSTQPKRLVPSSSRVEQRLAVENDPASVGCQQSRDQPERGRFTGSRRSEKHGAFAVDGEPEVEFEPWVDLSRDLDIEAGQEPPRRASGQSGCTIQSATIEMSETAHDSQVAR